MSGVRKIASIESPANGVPNYADFFSDGAIPRLHWFPSRLHVRVFTQNACVYCHLTHSVPITHEASHYGLLLLTRQDTRP